MAKTPWETAAVGSEFSEQRALFTWVPMAISFGIDAANCEESYKVTGFAAAAHRDNMSRGIDDRLPQLKWLHAIKNQGHGDKIRGNRSKSEGVKAGVSDLFLPVGRVFDIPYTFGTPGPFPGAYGVLGSTCTLTAYRGLYIELKKPSERNTKNGGASDIQLEFQADMRRAGYACEVAHGWQGARDLLLTYLGHSVTSAVS